MTKWTSLFAVVLVLSGVMDSVASADQNKADPASVIKAANRKGDTVRFNITIPKAYMTDELISQETFQNLAISSPRIGAIDFGEGRPELPVRKVLVRIPDGATFTTKVTNLKKSQIKGVKLKPKQYRYMNAQDDTFKKDADFYKSEKWYPSRKNASPDSVILSAHTVNLRNERFAEIVIGLAFYQPSSGRLEIIESLDLDVTVIEGSNKTRSKLKPSTSFSKVVATGDYDMLAPMSVTNPMPAIPAGTLPEKFMIIYNDRYAGHPLFEEFIQWKRRKGYEVVTVTTSSIGGSKCTGGEINTYLKGLPDAEWPTYLLLVGHNDQTNGVAVHSRAVSYGISVKSDYFYSLRTYSEETGKEDWDLTNTNSHSTDPNDWIDEYPDLILARIPAENDITLTNILKKVMYMDRTPLTSSDHYQKTILVGARGGGLYLPEPISDAMSVYFQETYGDSKLEMAFHGSNYSAGQVITASSPGTLWQNGFWQVSDIHPAETVGSNAAARLKLIEEWNKGAAFVNYDGHGGPGAWYWNNKGDNFFKADAAALTNKNKYALVHDSSCSTSQETGGLNMTQTLLDDQDGGAYAMVAAPSTQFAGYLDFLSFGLISGALGDFLTFYRDYPDTHAYPAFDDPAVPVSYIPGQATRLGQMWWTSKLYILETYPADNYDNYAFGPRCNRAAYKNMYLQTLYGDPESFFRFNQPSMLAVTHTDAIATGPNTIEITTEEGAMVCLYSSNFGIQQAKIADASGLASFNISPASAGAISVTASKYDRVPYEGGFAVGSNTGPQSTQTTVSAMPAIIDTNYEYDLSAYALDAEGDDIFFTKLSGPDWLGITEQGGCYGVPVLADLGSQVCDVHVSDASGLGSDFQMTVEVTLPPEPPTFAGWSEPNNLDLTCHWTFDLNYGDVTMDDSNDRRDGVVTGPTWTDSGKIGPAMSFDATADTIKHNLATAETWPTYTVALWAKPAVTNQPKWSGIFNNNSSGSDFQLGFDGGNNLKYQGSVTLSFGAATTQWTHLAVTCDGTTTRIYRDGALVASGVAADTLFGRIQLGCNRNADTFFNGMIDDLYVYKRALTAAEIAAMKNWSEYSSNSVGPSQLSTLIPQWLNTCATPNWCNGADIDFNGKVDLNEIQILAQSWLN
jgi:hypothetical protein